MAPNEAGQATTPAWRKASFCASSECVEITQRDGMIVLRDSAQPHGVLLRYAPADWTDFLRIVKAAHPGRVR